MHAEELKLPQFSPTEEELGRHLIEQFYQRSIEYYGPDSEQSRMLLQLRAADTSGLDL